MFHLLCVSKIIFGAQSLFTFIRRNFVSSPLLSVNFFPLISARSSLFNEMLRRMTRWQIYCELTAQKGHCFIGSFPDCGWLGRSAPGLWGFLNAAVCLLAREKCHSNALNFKAFLETNTMKRAPLRFFLFLFWVMFVAFGFIVPFVEKEKEKKDLFSLQIHWWI